MPRKIIILLPLLILLLLAGVVYSYIWGGYFVSDDFIFLSRIKDEGYVPYSGRFFRPASQLLLWVNYSVWNIYATPYLILSLLIHVTNVALVFYVARSVRGNNNTFINYTAALLFLAYPFASETVYWISAQGILCCTLFMLLSFMLSMQPVITMPKKIVAAIFFFIALLFYEAAWCFPAIVMSYDVIVNKKSWAVTVQRSLWMIAGFFIYILWRWMAVHQLFYDYGHAFSLWQVAIKFPQYYFMLAGRAIIMPLQSTPVFVICFLTLIAIVVWLWFRNRNKIEPAANTTLIFLCTAFLLSLIPYINYGINIHSIEQGRYLYFGSVWLVIFMVVLSHELWSPPFFKLAMIACGTYFIWFHMQSGQQWAKAYATTREFFTKVSEITTDSIVLINVPADINGAFVFRNGVTQCVSLANKSIKGVEVLSANTPAMYTGQTRNTIELLPIRIDAQRIFYPDSKLLVHHNDTISVKSKAVVIFHDGTISIR